MNLGLSNILKEAFPDIIPVQRPVIKLPKSINPFWLAGFTEGDWCFLIVVYNSSTCKVGKAVKLRFIITQHERDRELLELIIKYLNSDTLATSGNCKQVILEKFQDI